MDKKTQQAHDDVRTLQELQRIFKFTVVETGFSYDTSANKMHCSIIRISNNLDISLWCGTSMVLSPSYFCKSFDEIREQYFSDILRPTENELVMFKLMHGFDWILKEDGTSNLEETFKQLEELYPHGN